jgi:hypothetical protein
VILAKRAILVSIGEVDVAAARIGRILDFFGVPWEMVEAPGLQSAMERSRGFAVLGSVEALAAAPGLAKEIKSGRCGAIFCFAGTSRADSEKALRKLAGSAQISLNELSAGDYRIAVSRDVAEFTGPMAGLVFPARHKQEGSALAGVSVGCEPIITSDDAPLFVRIKIGSAALYFSTNSECVNIDEPVGRSYYDVKDHFHSVVPLVMFIRGIFKNTAWKEQELGACLIIDDPLLKQCYGSCDFRILSELMERHQFTTNIAFIPWNWRRTSKRNAEFFKETGLFSISVHGCDHTKGEFGHLSREPLYGKAVRALSRMQQHEVRTGIRHCRVMVFPQGVFSSICPAVLKRTGYVAAVNTETVPVDDVVDTTRIRDVWDLAITRYGSFPIFTRRYAHHGLENFAFDLLLGKPCLIVSHHGFFKNRCTEALELIEKVKSLNCQLRWRSLGEVVRHACRRRELEKSSLEVQMYGSQLVIENKASSEMAVDVRKMDSIDAGITSAQCDGFESEWAYEGDSVVIRGRIKAESEMRVELVYKSPDYTKKTPNSILSGGYIAMRRILSEVRDEYFA